MINVQQKKPIFALIKSIVMTLQQMEYIVAVDKFRHFAQAADACGITQPTLSTMIQKLEDELGTKIFNRSNKKVEPTAIGVKIIRQAKNVVNEAGRVKEMVHDEINTVTGTLNMGILTTVAPYIVPDFIYFFRKSYPDVDLFINEMKMSDMLSQIKWGDIDAGIGVGGAIEEDILEIPLFTEKFVLYLSSHCNQQLTSFTPDMLGTNRMWVLKEGHCIKDAAFSFCKSKALGKQIYEAGSIDTLIKIVDKNEGYTIIPELHKSFLTAEQLTRVRDISALTPTTHSISMYIRTDYIRERMLNAIGDTIKRTVPYEMIDERLKKYSIRL